METIKATIKDARFILQILALIIMGVGIIFTMRTNIDGHIKDDISHVRINDDGLPIYVTRKEFEEIKIIVKENNQLLTALAAKQGIQIQGK